jgi:hypothetical protein
MDEIYEGEQHEGKKHGKGKITYSDGYTYEGDWKNDEQHGDGIATYPDGVNTI